jgi:hypothetical protein
MSRARHASTLSVYRAAWAAGLPYVRSQRRLFGASHNLLKLQNHQIAAAS